MFQKKKKNYVFNFRILFEKTASPRINQAKLFCSFNKIWIQFLSGIVLEIEKPRFNVFVSSKRQRKLVNFRIVEEKPGDFVSRKRV